MSRVLFFTSMTMPLMMFMAAMATTMPRMMLMATRSTFSAPQMAAWRLRQSVTTLPDPAAR